MTNEQLSYRYDQLYNEMEALLEKYNPCRFDPMTGVCYGVRTHTVVPEWRLPFVLCCRNCYRRNKHSKKLGCRVKSLGCKLFVCSAIDRDKTYRPFFRERYKLLIKVRELLPDYPAPFMTKTQYVKEQAIKEKRN